MHYQIAIILIIILCIYVIIINNKSESFTLDAPEYTNIGCFYDYEENESIIPYYVGRVGSVNEAVLLARKHNAPFFGIQDRGNLYLGYDIEKAISLGQVSNEENSCIDRHMELGICDPMGNYKTNQIYVARTNYNYEHEGYYNNLEELNMIYVKYVNSVKEAEWVANRYGATVFSIKNNYLYVGYNAEKLNNLMKLDDSCDKSLVHNVYKVKN